MGDEVVIGGYIDPLPDNGLWKATAGMFAGIIQVGANTGFAQGTPQRQPFGDIRVFALQRFVYSLIWENFHNTS